MDAAGFMIFMVLLWAWFYPEDTGRWVGTIAKGFRAGLAT